LQVRLARGALGEPDFVEALPAYAAAEVGVELGVSRWACQLGRVSAGNSVLVGW
jgi:hypothetical protein